jgi:hypothetical protein
MIVYGILFTALLTASGVLIKHLGAGSIPGALKPLAGVWVKSGYTHKSFSLILWGLFALVATAEFIFLGFAIYTAIMGLGTGFK